MGREFENVDTTKIGLRIAPQGRALRRGLPSLRMRRDGRDQRPCAVVGDNRRRLGQRSQLASSPRSSQPRPAKPISIIAQVDGSGTAPVSDVTMIEGRPLTSKTDAKMAVLGHLRCHKLDM